MEEKMMNQEIMNKDVTGKISVAEYIEDNSKLIVNYIPFDEKMNVASRIITGIVNALGGLNSSLLRRVSTEVFIETISNIDLNIVDENGLKGFDQLCYRRELDKLKEYLGNEYTELAQILSEYVSDYIRTETNPAITIQKIYEQSGTYLNNAFDYISNYIQSIDAEKAAESIRQIISSNIQNQEG